MSTAPGRPGPPSASCGARLLAVTVTVGAVALAVAGLLLPVPHGGPLPAPWGVALAAGLAFAAQAARLRLRVGRGTTDLTWGEAAFMVSFPFAPVGWLPLATLAGAAAGLLVRRDTDRSRLAETLTLAAPLTVAAAVAAGIAYAVAGPGDAGVGTGRPPGAGLQLGLVAGTGGHLAVTVTLAVAALVARRAAPAGRALGRVLAAKLPMAAGGALLALATLVVVGVAPPWTPVLPVAAWLLHAAYRHRLRADAERATWSAYARAGARLAAGTTPEVAAAAVAGARDVFGARHAEITLDAAAPDAAAPGAAAPDAAAPDAAAPDLAAPAPSVTGGAEGAAARRYPGAADPGGPRTTRTLTAAGTPLGTLTVWAGPSGAPDADVLAAYAGAVAGALRDAAARERLAESQRRATRDGRREPLTGLLNRATLVTDGDRVLRGLDGERAVALLLLDINEFREVNGTLGHRAGDEVLGRVAERLTRLARAGELVARVGDDEFAVLLPGVAVLGDPGAGGPAPSPAPALRRARDLTEQLGAPMEVHGVRLVTEVTAGVAVSSAAAVDLVELIRRAAMAVSHAKRLRVPVAAYDERLEADSPDHLAVLAELREALAAGDQILLGLQPAVDLASLSPTGVEALVRWRHPRRGLLSPAAFIRAVEHSELLGAFTRRVLELAAAAAVDWIAAGHDVPVSVNVSTRSLLDPTFPAQVAQVLRGSGLPAGRLVLEITERVPVSDHEVVDEVLAGLRGLGVQLSVDDFGTGFSSLSFLTRVAVDELKVDRSFVAEMLESPVADAVVRAAVELGARVGARVVAEGVETAEQRSALIAAGCLSAQGYYFSQPQPADRIVAALTALAQTVPSKLVPLRADGAGQTG